MDKNCLKTIINDLKSSSSNRVQDALLKIRNKIIKSEDGIRVFRESCGMECLVPLLHKPNEKILDITLSILGNCCLDDECSQIVGKLDIYGPLHLILKNVYKDSILGRTCRVIGNLAQNYTIAECLHHHGVVRSLVTLIENRDRNTSYPTLTMAVRAIRLLWMVLEKRNEMLNFNAVRCVAILMTTECELAGIIKSTSTKEVEGLRKSQEELVNGILKCLGYFTTHSTVQCAEQIQWDGRGYQCLVALTKYNESLALKCLMNLCYLSSCRPLLGTAGFVECLVGILQKIIDVENWPEGAARTLAQLSGESVNRSRLRYCGGLQLLVNVAKVNHHAMHALLQYVFDDTAFQILINEGLISLLTEKLLDHLKTMDFDHNYIENIEKQGDNVTCKNNEQSDTAANPTTTSSEPNKVNISMVEKSNLFKRRKCHLELTNKDELKVVIERDNMIVGFVDAIDSDASDDDDDDDSDDEKMPSRRRNLKRSRSKSPKTLKKKSQLIKMANKDWCAGVYWEPKSPEWPTTVPKATISPERGNVSPMSPYSDGNQSGFSPANSGFSGQSKRARYDWSPESGFSAGEGSSSSPYWTEYQWSPSSSGSLNSPHSGNDDSSDSDISGRYSPVCSEVDGETGEVSNAGNFSKEAAAELDAAQVTFDLDELIVDDDESFDEEVPLEDEANKINLGSKSSNIACVLVLLYRVSHGTSSRAREKPLSLTTLDLLTGNELLNALLDYVERCKRPLGRAGRILLKVLSNALCLMSILKNRLPLRLYSMTMNSVHPTTKCQQCKKIVRFSSKLLIQLAVLAESSYGIGEISYNLLKGSNAVKQSLSLILPYVVRTEQPLKNYLVDCKALDILLSVITEATEKLEDCVTGLGKLATNVHIKDPKTLESRFEDQIYMGYEPLLENLNAEDIVTFELDDLSTVQANKVFLCKNSEVFSAMLSGWFKESIEKSVRLKNVTKPALEHLFTLLHCGLNNNDTKWDMTTFPMAQNLETNLEVLLLADRFLFERLKVLLSSAILQFKLLPETADSVYIWSLNDGMGFLCVEAVAYILTGKMCDGQRVRLFKAILDLEYREQWLDDIKTMILRQLVK